MTTGLNDAQVAARKEAGYSNKVTDTNEKSTGQVIFKNVFTFFNTIIFIIALVFLFFIVFLYSTGRGDVVDAHFGFSKFIFLIPPIMNVIVGTTQELHSLKIIKSLRIVSESKSRVCRNGETLTVPADDIVLDDIVVLGAGDQATCDVVVLDGEISVDESMLTGESDFIKKTQGDTVLSGSSIIVGSARARADKVGDDTYAAKLTSRVKGGERHKSELMTTILNIMKTLAVLLAVVTATVVITLVIKIMLYGDNAAVWDGMTLSVSDPVSWARIMITAGSFGVGIIPSGLVLITSVTLMISIVNLSKKETLIQELYSLENLSRVDVICLDKTGTLTDGKMSVVDVKGYAQFEDVLYHTRNLMASVEDRNQTAEAIFQKFGTTKTPDFKEAIPFSSATKSSGLLYNDGRKLLMGAPEYLLDKDDERLSYVSEQAAQGNRVLALKLDDELLCFFVLEDHVRETAKDTLAFFRDNGVKVKVISGDNPITVSKIAEICGVENADKYISLEGVPLEKIPEIAEEYTIFARVSPEQKEALVTALKKEGHKVAMTGDGVNDILALRKADSSITFAKATEAAKSCSDVVLLDNDFSHLKDVVGEGRRVISNIQKTAILYLMKSIAIITMAFALIPFAKGQMWYSVENAYMLEAAIIGTGGFLLSLEMKRSPLRGSFVKNIKFKSLSAGLLAAFAVIFPILLYTISGTPLITPENVRPMMTILLTLAGLVVMYSMCVPFTKFRAVVFVVVILSVIALGMMVPTSFVGGVPTGAEMFRYDSSAGQTIFDCQFVREFFKPWNAEVFRNLSADTAVYPVLKLFIFLAVPVYLLITALIDRRLAKEYQTKQENINTMIIIGKIMMMIAGTVMILDALLFIGERVFAALTGPEEGRTVLALVLLAVGIAISVFLSIFAGITSYQVYGHRRKRYVNRAFVLAIIMLVLTVIQMVFGGGISAFYGENILITINNILIDLVAIAIYVAGAVIVKMYYNKSEVMWRVVAG